MQNTVKLQAHRGVASEYPENTMPAFQAAVEQGYAYIETDPHFTIDNQCVLLHDCALNRTCRTETGEEIAAKIAIEDITYAEAQKYDAGLAMGTEFKGTRIPLLSELLEMTGNTNVTVKIDNRFRGFSAEQMESMFRIIEQSNAKVAVTCPTVELARLVRQRLPECEIHYDGYVDEKTVQELAGLIGSSEFYVWLGLDTPRIAWAAVPKASAELCGMVKRYAHLGIWILTDEDELEEAKRLGADLVETDGSLKPESAPSSPTAMNDPVTANK